MKDKIESIQILRGLAALSVVLFHYRFYLVPDGSDLASPNILFGWGAIGVDLFFVISGFIMIYVTHNKAGGFKSSIKFLSNRLTRILPAYYIILAFAFFTGGAMSTFHYPDKTQNFISALTFSPYLIEPAPLYIDDNSMYNIRWTLNYELYFYIAFSLCLLSKYRLTALALWFLLPIVVYYSLTNDLTLMTSGYNFDSVISRFLTNPIILEFGLGVFAGLCYFKLKNIECLKNNFFSFACLLAIITGIAFGVLTSYNLFSACAFSLLVLLFSLNSESITNMTPKIFILLGNISFSWYLIHNPLGNVITKRVEKIFPGAMHNVSGFILLLASSIIVAYFSHKFIEIKLTNKIRSVLTFKNKILKTE